MGIDIVWSTLASAVDRASVVDDRRRSKLALFTHACNESADVTGSYRGYGGVRNRLNGRRGY